MHEARANERMALKLDRQGFQERIALRRMDGRGRRLDGGVFGVVTSSGPCACARPEFLGRFNANLASGFLCALG